MYFDIDSTVAMHQTQLETALASAAREIPARRGRVIAASTEILLFDAPWWRVHGLGDFFVRQLPFGVSHGVFEATQQEGVSGVRFRISLFWLRVCIIAIVLLLIPAVVNPRAGNPEVVWVIFLASILGGALIYVAAIIASRRCFTEMLLGDK